MVREHGSCLFCAPEPVGRVFETELVFGLWDGYPVSPGHGLLVPRRHVTDWFEATSEEQAAIAQGIATLRAHIEDRHAPDGYNVGFNAGRAAGQTVFHLHVHVIPRYAGDVADPRGGVRWVVPDRAAYWTGGIGGSGG